MELADLEVEDDVEIEVEDDIDEILKVEMFSLSFSHNLKERTIGYTPNFLLCQFNNTPSTPPPDFA
jgi:hypothetical protein